MKKLLVALLLVACTPAPSVQSRNESSELPPMSRKHVCRETFSRAMQCELDLGRPNQDFIDFCKGNYKLNHAFERCLTFSQCESYLKCFKNTKYEKPAPPEEPKKIVAEPVKETLPPKEPIGKTAKVDPPKMENPFKPETPVGAVCVPSEKGYDDPLEKYILVATYGCNSVTEGSGDVSFSAVITKRSKESPSLGVFVSFTSSWMNFSSVRYLFKGKLTDKNVKRTYADVSCRSGGCNHYESFSFDVNRKTIENWAENGGKLRFGSDTDVDIDKDEAKAFLSKFDEIQARIKSKPGR